MKLYIEGFFCSSDSIKFIADAHSRSFIRFLTSSNTSANTAGATNNKKIKKERNNFRMVGE